jgi:HEAT repeat protein
MSARRNVPAPTAWRLILLAVAAVSCGCTKKSDVVLSGGKPADYWVQALSGPDPKLRKTAADKLGNAGSGNSAVAIALCGALQDRSAEVRCAAILALVKSGPPPAETRERLKAMLAQDPDARVRDYARKSLEKLDGRNR